ncbi:hypothetical protein CYY_002918 [Polysphondylium violaceum]|uniref:Cytochrome P450 family protein n=1 Tax=Polysphondylium violaceum TaxID=133409 RepID=A0A8J4PYJ4_9MYCE|nr:hypothetical protein CYY_002918 [Polysphondylium violaceum]
MLLVIVLLILGYIVLDYARRCRLVFRSGVGTKGPFPLPIVGNLYQLGDKPHEALLKYHKQYGPVYRLWMGDYHCTVINDSNLLKKMLNEHIGVFLHRLDIPSIQYFSHNFEGLGFVMDSDKWKERRNATTFALSKNKTRHLYSLMDSSIEEFLQSMKQHSSTGEPFQPHYFSDKLITDLSFKMCFNVEGRNNVYSKRFRMFSDSLNQIVVDLGAPTVYDFSFLLQPFLLKYYQYVYKHSIEIEAFIDQEYDEHIKSFKPEHIDHPRDFIDTIIGRMDEKYSRDQVKTIVVDLVFNVLAASIDSPTGLIEWAFVYLANNPIIQEQVCKELETVIGDRKLSLSDKLSTPYLNAFIKELQRIKPLIPFLPRTCSEDIEIDGVFIPKNTQIIVNFYGIAHSEKYWNNPREFNPSRFLDSKNVNLDYSIFGIGKRSCVGQFIAQDILYLAIGGIIKSFKVSTLDGASIDDSGNLGLTLKVSQSFKVSLKERILN